MKVYFQEFKKLRLYVGSIFFTILLSYSTYLFFSKDVVMKIGSEDELFEWLTTICLFGAAIFFIVASKLKNIFLIILFLGFIFGAGEEISWGQRIFNFETPEYIKDHNVQKEFTLHNIELFNTKKFDLSSKKGLERFTEINFIFRIFCGIYGVFLPLCVYHIKSFGKIAWHIKLPIPPFSIGIFFLLAWISFRIVMTLLPEDGHPQYLDTAVEIFEFLAAYIFFIISIYFFKIRNDNKYGLDIKSIENW